MWKTNQKDPSSHYLMWNFHPDNNLDYLSFYFLKERGYSITEDMHHYQPEIQMDFRQQLSGEQTYGFTKLPEEWTDNIKAENNLMASAIPDRFFSEFFLPPQYYIGWRSKSHDGNDDVPPFPRNRNGFGSGDGSIEFVRFIDRQELYQK
ncbi:hypothetical protein [Mesobacillus subterraneus]|uniref:Uncharacterized protein n=1 Tax=Mesobacillus subterraneus TaxID=285983 RepID=A0A427TM77_9BACI|nr:hypothetical protein [Mesobacillus subterraneus]RSD25463.1 hypothetical protein EJA10_16790 [Mesobacillus subterraneus]